MLPPTLLREDFFPAFFFFAPWGEEEMPTRPQCPTSGARCHRCWHVPGKVNQRSLSSSVQETVFSTHLCHSRAEDQALLFGCRADSHSFSRTLRRHLATVARGSPAKSACQRTLAMRPLERCAKADLPEHHRCFLLPALLLWWHLLHRVVSGWDGCHSVR